MALDKLLASCPEVNKMLEYFKIKARIERRIDKFVANVEKQTNNKKLVSKTLTELVHRET